MEKWGVHFIDTKAVNVNSETYINLIEEKLLPDLYPRADFILQQDSATPHTSARLIDF